MSGVTDDELGGDRLRDGVSILTAGCNPEQDPVAVQSTNPGKRAGKSSGAPKGKTFPIKLTAKRAHASKSVLSDGGALSCVKVTVTHQTKEQLEVKFPPEDRRETNPPFSEAARAQVVP